MSVAIITGSAGLVGSEAVRYFASLGMDVVGIDNGMRAEFFGAGAFRIYEERGGINDRRMGRLGKGRRDPHFLASD